jgi:hypothetical protein
MAPAGLGIQVSSSPQNILAVLLSCQWLELVHWLKSCVRHVCVFCETESDILLSRPIFA